MLAGAVCTPQGLASVGLPLCFDSKAENVNAIQKDLLEGDGKKKSMMKKMMVRHWVGRGGIPESTH